MLGLANVTIPVISDLPLGYMMNTTIFNTLAYSSYCSLLYYGVDYFVPVRLRSVAIPGLIKNGLAKSFLSKARRPETTDLGLFERLGYIPPNSFDNIENLEQTPSNVPVLIIYGEQDTLMGGQRRGLDLYAAAPKQSAPQSERLVGLQGGHMTHGLRSTVGKEKIDTFMKSAFPNHNFSSGARQPLRSRVQH